jgi:hypothetical protein
MADGVARDPQLNLELVSRETAGPPHHRPHGTVGREAAHHRPHGTVGREAARDRPPGAGATDSGASRHQPAEATDAPPAEAVAHRPARTTFLVGRVTPGSGEIMVGGFPSPPFPGPWTLRALIRPPRLLPWTRSDTVH